MAQTTIKLIVMEANTQSQRTSIFCTAYWSSGMKADSLNCPSSSSHCHIQTAVTPSKFIQGFCARDPDLSRIVLLFHNLRCEVVLWVWCLPLALHQGCSSGCPTSLKQILFFTFTTVIWGLSTQYLMLAFYGKNSMPTSSYCTPVLCMRALFGVHTQVTKVSGVSWSVAATYRTATADPLTLSNSLPLSATLFYVLGCTLVPRVMPWGSSRRMFVWVSIIVFYHY